MFNRITSRDQRSGLQVDLKGLHEGGSHILLIDESNDVIVDSAAHHKRINQTAKMLVVRVKLRDLFNGFKDSGVCKFFAANLINT
mmetsp:Transcript_9971/g.15747  ORF Transcript_9971/g.15747 Transcript_9971/m.15747 type:complete len:85 (-) Transcript_9971:316-570(-)